MPHYFVSMYTDGPAIRWSVIDRQTQEWVCRFASKQEADAHADKLNSHMTSPNTPMSVDKRFKRTLDALNEARDRRNSLMPDEQSALRVLYMAWERLKDFGWNDPIYCPKDGTEFDVIELGSTGVFSGRYDGTWPNGHWELMDDRDVYPTSKQPALFRLRTVRVPAYADPNFKFDEATGSYRRIAR